MEAHGPLLKNPCLEVRYEDTVADLESVSRRVWIFWACPGTHRC